MLRVAGKSASETFANEPGGHRWQRIPPSEKRGRVHTSTVTVAVLPEPREHEVVLTEAELDFKFCRGSGNGGQHRNVTDSACIATHIATGLQVRCEAGRSQHENKASAIAALRARLWQAKREQVTGERDGERRRQIGSGMRGDKVRTIRVRDDIVNDHVTGRQWKFRKYERGDW